jgi:hypothetical protein
MRRYAARCGVRRGTDQVVDGGKPVMLGEFGMGRLPRRLLPRSVAIALAVFVASSVGAVDRVSPYPAVTKMRGAEDVIALSIERPVIRANAIGDLEGVQRWSDAIALQVPAVIEAGSRTREGYERIMGALYEWAGAGALEQMRGDEVRSLAPRRVLGAVMGYLAVKPLADASGDIRRQAIERWIGGQAARARDTFGTGSGGRNVLDYNNNLQATAATLGMAAFVITGDEGFKTWSIQSTREVLDEIDAEGFTGEARRDAGARAEQRSHEVMIYVVGTAVMAEANGDPGLWSYIGAGASASAQPAILRAGLLLGQDMGSDYVTKRYATRAGKVQAPYPGSHVVEPGRDGLVVPAGWLTAWIAPFLTHYAKDTLAPGIVRLQNALQGYRTAKLNQFNGALPLIGNVVYPSKIPAGKRAIFLAANR